jgi:hypothetical protein
LAATSTSVEPTVFSTCCTSRGPDTIFLAIQAAPKAAVNAIASTVILALFMDFSFRAPSRRRNECFTLTLKLSTGS